MLKDILQSLGVLTTLPHLHISTRLQSQIFRAYLTQCGRHTRSNKAYRWPQADDSRVEEELALRELSDRRARPGDSPLVCWADEAAPGQAGPRFGPGVTMIALDGIVALVSEVGAHSGCANVNEVTDERPVLQRASRLRASKMFVAALPMPPI